MTLNRASNIALICFLAFFLPAFSASALAQSLTREVNFNIAPQPLASAVIEFSKQAEVQVLASGEKLNGLSTSGVSGRHTIDSGLRALLKGTGFAFRVAGEGTVTLTKAEAGTSSSAQN